jgi:hypothetical protein
MKELKDGYQNLTEALRKIDQAASTTTHQGDHAILMTCSYNIDRALKLVHFVEENLTKFKIFGND